MPRASHPEPVTVEAPPPAPARAPAQGQANAMDAPRGVPMKGHSPGARLGVRLAQALLAAAALAAMTSTNDFASVTVFRYLVLAAALQCLWSLALSILYLYTLLVGRPFRSRLAAAILDIGDWITGTLTLSAALASAEITVFIKGDIESCYVNHCPRYMSATATAFLSWFALALCCVLNLGAAVFIF